MKWLVLLLLVVAAFDLWVRLAPFDVALWHVDPLAAPDPGRAGHKADLYLPLTPEAALGEVEAVAEATPRTRRLAGGAETGRISFITRTPIWGFPDVTTVSAEPAPGGATLHFYARARFGAGDLGVNKARVVSWITSMQAARAKP